MHRYTTAKTPFFPEKNNVGSVSPHGQVNGASTGYPQLFAVLQYASSWCEDDLEGLYTGPRGERYSFRR